MYLFASIFNVFKCVWSQRHWNRSKLSASPVCQSPPEGSTTALRQLQPTSLKLPNAPGLQSVGTSTTAAASRHHERRWWIQALGPCLHNPPPVNYSPPQIFWTIDFTDTDSIWCFSKVTDFMYCITDNSWRLESSSRTPKHVELPEKLRTVSCLFSVQSICSHFREM